MRTFTLLISIFFLSSVILVSSGNSLPSSISMDAKKERMVYLKNMSEKMYLLISANEPMILKSALLTHKLDSIVSETRSTISDPWHKEWKSEFTYTGSWNNLWIESEWNGELLKWIVNGRVEWAYNDDGLQETMTVYAIPEEGVSLVKSTVLKIEYDEQKRLKSIIYEEDMESVWGEALKQEYFYDSSGKISRIDTYMMQEGAWLLAMKDDYTYNANGHLTGMSTLFIEEGEEIIFSSTLYTVDVSGRVITTEYSIMDFYSFELVKLSKTDYEYTANGDVSVSYGWSWDDTGEVWARSYKDEYSYNNSISMGNILFPSYVHLLGQFEAEMLSFQRMPTEVLYYDYTDNAYVHLEKETYFYSEINTTIARTIQEKGYAMYPVPAGEKVIFTWSGEQKPMRLQIFSMDGRLVKSRELESLVPVDVQDLNEGLYMFRLSDDNRITYKGKLVIQR
ncbi:MAG TPA: hypothetical protein DCY35_00415 [Prolixibacteraceae bacterium]|nr:hypothetical protein [Prolixibacteraceae bacterium]